MLWNTEPLFKTIDIDVIRITQWRFWLAYDRSCQYILSIKLLKALETYIVKANIRPEIGLYIVEKVDLLVFFVSHPSLYRHFIRLSLDHTFKISQITTLSCIKHCVIFILYCYGDIAHLPKTQFRKNPYVKWYVITCFEPASINKIDIYLGISTLYIINQKENIIFPKSVLKVSLQDVKKSLSIKYFVK